jgi:hypothetical protein
MLRARGRFALVFLAFGLSLISGKAAHSEDLSLTSPRSIALRAVIPRLCGDRWPASRTQRESGSPREADRPDILCAEVAFDPSATASPGHADVREKPNEDPVLEELMAMGERGPIIERAREEVVEILQGHNGCAAWFAQAEPDAARKFRSLRYTIDEGGPQYTLKTQNAAGGWLYQQPYVASSIEDASAGSTITINGKGAFFQVRSGVRIVPKDGGPRGLSAPRLQQIGLYIGGTLGARVTTLLHEFSHVVGLLPADGDSVYGPELSTQNTQIVLRHCRAEVEAAGKHKGLFWNPRTGSFPRGTQKSD